MLGEKDVSQLVTLLKTGCFVQVDCNTPDLPLRKQCSKIENNTSSPVRKSDVPSADAGRKVGKTLHRKPFAAIASPDGASTYVNDARP